MMFGISELWWMVIAICATMIASAVMIAGAVTRHQLTMLEALLDITYALRHMRQSNFPTIRDHIFNAESEEEPIDG